MKMKNKSSIWRIRWMLMAVTTLCFVGCKDDKAEETVDFDPSKPVVIDRFLPEKGGLSTRLVLYGDNFGNDVSKIEVTIGGQPAKVIGVKSQSLHCCVPPRAYDGDIVVSVLNNSGEKVATVKATEKFIYEKKMLVTTFLGKFEADVKNVVKKDGPFGDCGSFQSMSWMTFDPMNHNHMYIACEDKGTRLVDFEKEYVGTFTTNISNVRCVGWTPGGDQGSCDLIATRDISNDTEIGLYRFTRASEFKTRNDVCKARGLRSVDTHPVDGDVYFSLFRAGWVQKYNFQTNTGPVNAVQNQFAGVAFWMQIHPTGNYAYIVNTDKSYILRTDYDWATHSFGIPYLVCGTVDKKEYADGVGSKAYVNKPRQGTFVKNEEYVELGLADQYDFYFCDTDNHAIRKLTPVGRVETFAGRGNNGTSGYADGDLRLEARFNSPTSIIYDEVRKCFYVGDSNNYLIRKIGYEE